MISAKIKIKFLILSAIFFGIVFFSDHLFAYDEIIVHPSLTQEMAKLYNLNSAIWLTDEEINWIKKGSADEDLNIGLAARSSNHFYNPSGIKKWADDSAQANIVSEPRLTAKQWAHNSSEQAFSSGGDFSWERAIRDYASGDKKRAYEGLGHILHLIEDMAVPAHTRNDLHISYAVFGYDKGEREPYEDWTRDRAREKKLNFDLADKLRQENKKPAVRSTLDGYFDEIAVYTNTNFFSQDTVEKYSNPKISTYRLDNYFLYAIGNDFDSNEVLLFRVENGKYVFDDKVFQNYWSHLAPKAVLTGAGVIKLFKNEAEKAAENSPVADSPWIVKYASRFSGGINDWILRSGGTIIKNELSLGSLLANGIIYGGIQTARAVRSSAISFYNWGKAGAISAYNTTSSAASSAYNTGKTASITVFNKTKTGLQLTKEYTISSIDSAAAKAGDFFDSSYDALKDYIFPGPKVTLVFDYSQSVVPYDLAPESSDTMLDSLTEEEVPAEPDYSADLAILDQEQSFVFTPGKDIALSAQIKNTGNVFWQRNKIFLNVYLPEAEAGNFYHSSWLTAKLPAVIQDAAINLELPIAPGAYGVFVFNIKSPEAPGKYFFRARPVWEENNNLNWLGEDIAVWTIDVKKAEIEAEEDIGDIGDLENNLTGENQDETFLPSIAPTPSVAPSPTPIPKLSSSPTPKPTPFVSYNRGSGSSLSSVPTPTRAPTPTPTLTPVPTPTSTPTPTLTPIPTPTPILTPTPTPTLVPTPTSVPDPSITPTPVLTPVPTITPTPTIIPTVTPTLAPTAIPTVAPTPTSAPTPVPTLTLIPTPTPTLTPTPAPDIIPPETAIVEFPESSTIKTTVSFRFYSSEENSTFQCSLDGSEFVSCGEYTIFENLDLGGYILKVKAKDESGNIDETPAEYSWTIKRSESAAHLVISEIRSGTNENGAKDEFVELYNPTDQEVNLAGWELRRKNADGDEENLVDDGAFSGIIPAKSFFLIAHKDYKGPVDFDLEYSIDNNLSYKDNSVILYNGDHKTGAIIDEVSYSDITKGQSLERKAWQNSECVSPQGKNEFLGNSCDASDMSDFEIRIVSDPQNLKSIKEPVLTPVHNITTGFDYPKIQLAIDRANSGDEIQVDSGTYYENVIIGKRLILKGIDTGKGKPIVDARKNESAITLAADGITLEGFVAAGGGFNSARNYEDSGIKVVSKNNILTGNDASSNGIIGIHLKPSSGGNTLTGNIANMNNIGIHLDGSGGNVLNKNTTLYNKFGIRTDLSDDNTISNNNASSNTFGIHLEDSSGNMVSGNIADANILYGINMEFASGNTLDGNSFKSNIFYAMSLIASPDNNIYHNNFLDNANQINNIPAGIVWDDGYPSGGNYWENYAATAVDEKKGANQDEEDSDGVGDTPYIVLDSVGKAIIQDRYPLMKKYEAP